MKKYDKVSSISGDETTRREQKYITWNKHGVFQFDNVLPRLLFLRVSPTRQKRKKCFQFLKYKWKHGGVPFTDMENILPLRTRKAVEKQEIRVYFSSCFQFPQALTSYSLCKYEKKGLYFINKINTRNIFLNSFKIW